MLSLFNYGKTTGLVVDCGDGACTAVPVYEGSVCKDMVFKSATAGKKITNYLLDPAMLGYEINSQEGTSF